MNRLTGKVVLCGDGGVGKTSLRRAYLGQEFNSNYLETLGADFATKIIKIASGVIMIIVGIYLIIEFILGIV